MVRHRIVGGIESKELRRRLLDKGRNLNLEDAIKIARNFETTGAQLEEMRTLQTTNVKQEIDAISTRGARGGFGSARGRGRFQ